MERALTELGLTATCEQRVAAMMRLLASVVCSTEGEDCMEGVLAIREVIQTDLNSNTEPDHTELGKRLLHIEAYNQLPGPGPKLGSRRPESGRDFCGGLH